MSTHGCSVGCGITFNCPKTRQLRLSAKLTQTPLVCVCTFCSVHYPTCMASTEQPTRVLTSQPIHLATSDDASCSYNAPSIENRGKKDACMTDTAKAQPWYVSLSLSRSLPLTVRRVLEEERRLAVRGGSGSTSDSCEYHTQDYVSARNKSHGRTRLCPIYSTLPLVYNTVTLFIRYRAAKAGRDHAGITRYYNFLCLVEESLPEVLSLYTAKQRPALLFMFSDFSHVYSLYISVCPVRQKAHFELE